MVQASLYPSLVATVKQPRLVVISPFNNSSVYGLIPIRKLIAQTSSAKGLTTGADKNLGSTGSVLCLKITESK